MATYTPQPGTFAYRILGWLEEQGQTREFTASQIGEALGIKPGGLCALLEPALAGKRLFRRQKDRTRPTAPWFYSLTDHDAQQRQFTRPKPAEWMPRPANLEPEVEPDTPTGDQPRSERGREVMEPAVCESADGRGTTGAPALATLSQHASPGVGPMGAGQPADAGPTTGEPAEPEPPPVASRLVDGEADADVLPDADLAATRKRVKLSDLRGIAPPQRKPEFKAWRCTDGSLLLKRGDEVIVELTIAETDMLQRLFSSRAEAS